MLLGLYSKIARRDIVRLRKSIAEQGNGTTADEIRRCRQDPDEPRQRCRIGGWTPFDLFTISSCRDLLHVQEHHVTLTEIAGFLDENNLAFLGFEILAADVLHPIGRVFPEDRAATNPAQWQVFENES